MTPMVNPSSEEFRVRVEPELDAAAATKKELGDDHVAHHREGSFA